MRCSAKRCTAAPGPPETVTVPGLQRTVPLRFTLRCARDTRERDGQSIMLLSDVLIIDATERLGWVAGRVLADLGADVVKLEPPGSDRGGDILDRGMLVQCMADRDDRGLVAAAHARRPHHPHRIA